MMALERYTFDEQRQVVDHNEQRQAPFFDLVARARYMYRFGVWNTSVGVPEMLSGWVGVDDVAPAVRVPMATKYIDTLVSSMVARYPQFSVEAAGSSDFDDRGARLLEQLALIKFEETGALQKLRLASLDAKLSGNGFLYVGWDYEDEELSYEDVKGLYREALSVWLEDDDAPLEVFGLQVTDELVDGLLDGSLLFQGLLVDSPLGEDLDDNTLVGADVSGQLAELLPTLPELLPNVSEVQERKRHKFDENGEPVKGSEHTERVWVRVVRNRPFVEYVSPLDVIVPQHGTEVEDLPWYCVKRRVRLSEVRRNEMFDDKVRGQVISDSAYAQQGHSSGFLSESVSEPTPDETVTLYYFYDRQCYPRRVSVWCKSVSEPLMDVVDPNEFDEPCLVRIGASHDGESFHRFGSLEQIHGLLDLVAETVNHQAENLDKQGTIFIVDAKSFNKDSLAALEDAQTGDVIQVDRVGNREVPLSELIVPVPTTALSPDQYSAMSDFSMLVERALGISEYEMGGSGPSRGSGTQAAAAVDGTNRRSQGDMDAHELTATKVAKVLLRLCAQFYDAMDVGDILGGEAGQLWSEILFTQNVSGALRMRIRPGSMHAVTPQSKRLAAQDALAFAERLPGIVLQAQTPELSDSVREVSERLIRRVTDLLDMDMEGIGSLFETPEPLPEPELPPMDAGLEGMEGMDGMPPPGMDPLAGGVPDELGGGLPPVMSEEEELLAMLGGDPAVGMDPLLSQAEGDVLGGPMPVDDLGMMLGDDFV